MKTVLFTFPPPKTQIVGFNKMLYRNLNEAIGAPNGLAAVSFLHEECSDVTPEGTQIGIMTGLEEVLRSLKTPNQNISMNGFSLGTLLGNVDYKLFYRYQGSRTMPPCTENVIWTVFHRTVPILRSQVSLTLLLLLVVNRAE